MNATGHHEVCYLAGFGLRRSTSLTRQQLCRKRLSKSLDYSARNDRFDRVPWRPDPDHYESRREIAPPAEC